MTMLGRWLGAAGVTALVATTALAQSNPVAWSKIETGSWMMHPIYTEDPSGSLSVSNFLALADPSAATGDNLIAVWYRRELTGWTAKSWSTGDPWEAIKAVKIELGISDDEDDRWDIGGDDDSIPAAESPQDYSSGVLADDPLAPLVASSPDRDVIVEFLAGIGYKAADVPVEKDDGCTTDAKLDGMAAAIVETLQGGEETAVDRSMAAWIASGTAGCGVGSVAVEIVTHPPQPLGPFAPPTYVCTGPTTTYYEWPIPWYEECTCLVWTETQPITQRRTRARFNPAPPPTYQYCDQTRTGVRTKTTKCCACTINGASPPCPAITPPGSTPPIGSGCGAGGFAPARTTTSDGGWTAWTPACPF